jgi:hypothetical protein
LNTDPDDVGEDDLPLATGDDAPEVLDRDGEIAGANGDQSQTTVFLLRAARAAYPDSRFVRESTPSRRSSESTSSRRSSASSTARAFPRSALTEGDSQRGAR